MNILFLIDNFYPESNAPARRSYDHIREWEKLGANITVITSVPNFPEGKIFKNYKNKVFQVENYSPRIKIIRVWTYISPNKGKYKRIFDQFSFCVTSFFASLFVNDMDIIIASSPQFFTTWSAALISVVKKKPWIFELRDLWPESIRALSVINNDFIIKNLEKVEYLLYNHASAVISVSKSFNKVLENNKINKDKLFLIRNGAYLKSKSKKRKNKTIIKALGLENKFIVGFIGTLGLSSDLTFILKSISRIKDKDIHFLFIGSGAKKDDLIKKKKSLKLKNVSFLDKKDIWEIEKYISIIDIGLVNLKKIELFKTVIPSKIFEFVSFNKPILLGASGEAKELIEKYDIGLIYKQENSKSFIDNLLELKNNKKLYEKKVKNCKKAASHFDRKILAKNMYEILKQII